jgi:hypothetical protein
MIADLAPTLPLPSVLEVSPPPHPALAVPPDDAVTDPGAGLPPAKSEQPKKRKPRVPSKRNREIYRQHVLANRSQRDVAAEFDVTQPRVNAICKQVKRWLKSGQAELENMSDQERYNLVTNEARMRLNLAFSESYKWLQVTGQPSETRRVRPGQEDPEATYRPPNPKSPFIGAMLRAAIELAKLDGAGQYGQRPKPAPHPESPPSELLSRTADPEETCDDDLDELDDQTYYEATGISAKERRQIARRGILKEQNNCYRALAAAAGLTGLNAELLEDPVVDLELAAEEADELAQQELARTAADFPGETPQDRQARLEDLRLRHIVRLVDKCEADLADEAKMVAASRYDPRTGRFDWQRGDPRELAVLIEMRDYCREEEEEEGGG